MGTVYVWTLVYAYFAGTKARMKHADSRELHVGFIKIFTWGLRQSFCFWGTCPFFSVSTSQGNPLFQVLDAWYIQDNPPMLGNALMALRNTLYADHRHLKP